MAAPAIGIGQLQERAPLSKYALFNSQIFNRKNSKNMQKGASAVFKSLQSYEISKKKMFGHRSSVGGLKNTCTDEWQLKDGQ